MELNKVASLKHSLCCYPSLKYMFLELTRACNLHCLHCGSLCPEDRNRQMLSSADAIPVIDQVAKHTSPKTTMFCITGGEPLLNPDWEAVCEHIRDLGFSWGMTTNGTLIDMPMARQLWDAGMRTVSVSIDGLRETHEQLRGVPGCFDRAAAGVRTLSGCGYFQTVQVTTVVSKLNIHELEAIYQQVLDWEVQSWKVTGIEPIGSARKRRELLLDGSDYKRLFQFLQQVRRTSGIEVTYGCSHYLPDGFDNTVRDHHFLCGAGTLIASVTCEGDITACLDIDDRAHNRMGNIQTDDFWDVWTNGFQVFRENRKLADTQCGCCDVREFCGGGPWHTWDFSQNRPEVCIKEIMKRRIAI